MRRLAIRQLVDDFTKVCQTLVDHVCLFEKLASRTCFLDTLTACQIDKIQLSCLLAKRLHVGLLHCDDEAGVRA